MKDLEMQRIFLQKNIQKQASIMKHLHITIFILLLFSACTKDPAQESQPK